jgi:hypothetical protein
VTALAGPFIVAAALIGLGGALKLGRPATTARALGEMGLPSSPLLVRVGAAVEIAVAAGALAWASVPFAMAVALSYLGFAGFVLAALRRGVPLASCGCFGVQDTPPTYVHLALNLAAAGVAVAVALGPHGAALADLGRMDGSVVLRGVFLVLAATCTWFAYVALTLLPQVLGSPGQSRRLAAR